MIKKRFDMSVVVSEHHFHKAARAASRALDSAAFFFSSYIVGKTVIETNRFNGTLVM